MSVPGALGTGKNPSTPSFASSGGGMRVKHREFFGTVSRNAQQDVVPRKFCFDEESSKSMPPQLAALAKVYDRYILHSVILHYIPAVGSTEAGILTISIDWDSKDTEPTLSKAKAMWPQMTMPVWQPCNLPLPVAKLQDKKQMYTTDSPFSVQTAIAKGTAKTYGELHITYDITFYGVAGN